VFVAAPACQVAKTVVRCFNAIILANGISNAFSFNLLRALILLFSCAIALLGLTIMQFGMGYLVNGSCHGLYLTHALADSDFLVLEVVIAILARFHCLELNWD